MKKLIHILGICLIAAISSMTFSSCTEVDPTSDSGFVRFDNTYLVGTWALITVNDKPVPERDSFDLTFNSDLISGVWLEMSGNATVFQWYTENGRSEAARFLYLNFTDGTTEYYLARMFYDGNDWFLQLTDMNSTNILVLQLYNP